MLRKPDAQAGVTRERSVIVISKRQRFKKEVDKKGRGRECSKTTGRVSKAVCSPPT